MPLLVNTKVSKSEIHNLGLFADQFIPTGTLVWKHDSVLDGWISSNEIQNAPESFKKHLDYFCCYDIELDSYIVAKDNVNWINHSDNPNLNSPTKYFHIALRDINVGEELTLNYRQICDLEVQDIEFH